MDKIVNRFYRIMNISVFMYLIDIIVGVCLIYLTELSLKVCAVIIGSLILVHGLFSLIRYLYDGLANTVFAFDIVNAVASIILGIFAIFYSFDSVTLIGVLFGIWLTLYALFKLSYLFKLFKNNDEIYPLIGFITILEVIMGIIVIINPFSSFMLATKLAGYFLVATSLLDVIYCLLFKKRAKQILKMFE